MTDALRETQMRDFLVASGWGAATVAPLPGDASTRRYARLYLNGRTAMLMDQPQGAEAPVAPAIYAADCAGGFLILEDLGDALFAQVLADGRDENELYQAAVAVLARM